MKVTAYMTEGIYRLKTDEGNVLHHQPAKGWKTLKGAKQWAEKHGYEFEDQEEQKGDSTMAKTTKATIKSVERDAFGNYYVYYESGHKRMYNWPDQLPQKAKQWLAEHPEEDETTEAPETNTEPQEQPQVEEVTEEPTTKEEAMLRAETFAQTIISMNADEQSKAWDELEKVLTPDEVEGLKLYTGSYHLMTDERFYNAAREALAEQLYTEAHQTTQEPQEQASTVEAKEEPVEEQKAPYKSYVVPLELIPQKPVSMAYDLICLFEWLSLWGLRIAYLIGSVLASGGVLLIREAVDLIEWAEPGIKDLHDIAHYIAQSSRDIAQELWSRRGEAVQVAMAVKAAVVSLI